MKAFLQFALYGMYNFFLKSEYRKFCWLLLRYGSMKRFVPIKINIGNLKMNLPDAPSFVWQYKEIYRDKSYSFATKKKKNIIYDCGANVGTSCIWLSKNYPGALIKAYEADASVAKYLDINLQNNHIDNVHIINKAVWIHHGEIEFTSEGADGGSIQNTEGTKVKIPCIRLRDEIENEAEIDFLKMDIEGAECDVISDCEEVLHKIKNIFIEYHDFENDKQQLNIILDVLKKNNFRYLIEGVHHRKSPLQPRKKSGAMNLQLNIYGVRE